MDFKIGNCVTKLNLPSNLSSQELREARLVLLALGKFIHSSTPFKQYLERQAAATALASMLGDLDCKPRGGALQNDHLLCHDLLPHLSQLCSSARSPLAALIIKNIIDQLNQMVKANSPEESVISEEPPVVLAPLKEKSFPPASLTRIGKREDSPEPSETKLPPISSLPKHTKPVGVGSKRRQETNTSNCDSARPHKFSRLE